MNRDQIDRAERVAELAVAKRVLTQFRRMDEHDTHRKLVERLDRDTDEEQLRLEERRRYYARHVQRMEEVRQKFLADSIAEGVLKLSPGEYAVEFYNRRWRK